MPSTQLRQTVLSTARRVVVKIGTQLIFQEGVATPTIDDAFMASMTRQIADLTARGYRITLVSSGAIGCGCVELGLEKKPADVATAQAVASIGQRRLMDYWAHHFKRHGLRAGQVLLTRGDFDDRARFLNIRNCLQRLHELNCVPVLNENDTVAVDEIRFGDNDLLAALTCNAIKADACLLLTVVPGLLDAQGSCVDLVEDVVAHHAVTTGGKSRWGTGGMSSKLEAARLVTEGGEIAAIACGREKDVLLRLLAGEKLGTVFTPAKRRLDSRKRWIGLAARPSGHVTINGPAAEALRTRGRSLLAVGVTEVSGKFEKGEIILVRETGGGEVARGLTNYSADELRLIMGKRSTQFEKVLGRKSYAELVHRDNLVVTG